MKQISYRWIVACVSVSFLLVGGSVTQADRPGSNATMRFAVGKNGRPILIPVKLNGRIAQFLLETGAAKTCFDNSLKSEVGPVTGTATFSTPTGLQTTTLFQCPEAHVGSLSLHDVKTIGCVDLKPIRYVTGLDIYGIVGADFCLGKRLEIDFDTGAIAFGPMPRSESPKAAELIELPLAMITGVPHVRMELPGGKEEWIAIDTGANRTTVRSVVLDDLVNTDDASYIASHSAVSAGGISRSRFGKLSFLKLGTQRIEDVVIDGDSLSLLGLDQLSRFHLIMDLRNNKLTLSKGTAFLKPSPDATSGMSIIQDHGVKIVVGVKSRGPAFDAGIMAGDQILKVNGKPASNIDMFELREILTYGPEKTVRLEIKRRQRLELANLKLSAVGLR
ncbi:MAG: aspartyl protease family protein [Planctomycetaceae bacterium]|nr:aspartyl protease family protein [Planctomycetaceae bacterium]